MQETIALAMGHARMVWRYRWIALLISLVLCVLGWAYVQALPNVYEVKAKVFLDTRSLLRPLLSGLMVDNTMSESTARLMHRTLLVRPKLEAIARKTDLDLNAKTPEQFEAMLISLAKRIEFANAGGENIYTIAYQNTDPKLANRVVEAVLNLFIEESLGDSRKDTSKTKAFLERQIADYESRLEAAERRLKEFKQRNLGFMPHDGRGHLAKMQENAQLLEQAQLELVELERSRDQLQQQLGQIDRVLMPNVMPHSQRSANQIRLENAVTELDSLLLRYTDKHPDVVSHRDLIVQLEAQLERERAGERGSGNGRMQLENPVYQEIKVALSEREAQIASVTARVAAYNDRSQEYRKQVDMTLGVEAELQRLDRDYEVNRANYEALLKRRESLNIADDVNQTTDSIQFNVIEPPRVPLTPVAPNRALLNSSVLLMGFAVGVVFAWLIATLNPGIYHRKTITDVLNIPVLGSVSRVWTPHERFKRKIEVFGFALGCVALLGSFLVLQVVHELGINVVQEISSLAGKLL